MAELIQPSLASSGPADTPDEIDGVKERPLDPNDTEQFGFASGWLHMGQSYKRREAVSKTFLETCRSPMGTCNPRVTAWNDFVDRLKISGLDDKAKIEAVNIWVNELLHYDYSKPDTGIDWHQTPFTTLSTGMGQCGDGAYLKYETLKAIGIDDKEMRLVIGAVYKKDGTFRGYHMVLLANVEGANDILDITLTDVGYIPKKGDVEAANLYMRGPAGGSTVSSWRFVPLYSENGDGSHAYPYVSDEDGQIRSLPDDYHHTSDILTHSHGHETAIGNSTIEIENPDIPPELLLQLREFFRQAHDLNPSRSSAPTVPQKSSPLGEPDYSLIIPGAPAHPQPHNGRASHAPLEPVFGED